MALDHDAVEGTSRPAPISVPAPDMTALALPTATEQQRQSSTSFCASFADETDMDKRRTMIHDSLVTVRLPEPPSLIIHTVMPTKKLPLRRSLNGTEYTPNKAMVRVVEEEQNGGLFEETAPSMPMPQTHGRSLEAELQGIELSEAEDNDDSEYIERLRTPSPRESQESEDVDWEQLQKTEDQESKSEDSDNTALLLARLEQENNRLATNPKSVKVQQVEKQLSPVRRLRPPSMAQLREMVTGPTPPVLRYSMLPPPPMTDLEFYMALVKDYQQTAARLPTLLSNKIRKGIPPPLRGVVWQSMSGSRDVALEEMFDRLSGESSPYEGIIGKDLGRSFPGVDMFRDPEGDGQRMLGQVLKCFSLYDNKIGYCQGLAFLVGPLVMHMPEKQAFCVLVKLMESYDLRHCFVPDLSGLQVRIYQFGELLRQHSPVLSAHLDNLQVDPAYVSQWFLSFFAVTCPLPMLFRIYDVVFAEGSSETVMRVALSLMRKNQTRILACTEMEDVMQLLLSRGLWDCYHYNADEFVQEFVSLSDAVTRERLAALEEGYREAQIDVAHAKSADVARMSDVATAASRFLGRLWAASITPRSVAQPPASSSALGMLSLASTSTLSPRLVATSRSLSALRRSTSKQSLISTFNSMEAASSITSSSSASVLSTVSTDTTSISPDGSSEDSSACESVPALGGANLKQHSAVAASSASVRSLNKNDSKYLHNQIEDLLTALSELQRDHALLASQLQDEKDESDEDRKAVRSLLDGLRKKAVIAAATPRDGNLQNDAQTENMPSIEQLSDLLNVVEARLHDADGPRLLISQTKSQLLDELARAKEQLSNEFATSQNHCRRIDGMENELSNMKDQLRESHAHVRKLHHDKQRLEKQIHGMRVRASDSASLEPSDWFSRTTGLGGASSTNVSAPGVGLRELKLARSKSTPSQAPISFNKRVPSIMMQKSATSRETVYEANEAPENNSVGDSEALLFELVQAKTALAVAQQEAEEAKQKLESLRKVYSLGTGETPSPLTASVTNMRICNGTVASGGGAAAAAASAAMGMFGRLTGSGSTSESSPAKSAAAPPVAATATALTAPVANNGGGGFWGWRR